MTGPEDLRLPGPCTTRVRAPCLVWHGRGHTLPAGRWKSHVSPGSVHVPLVPRLGGTCVQPGCPRAQPAGPPQPGGQGGKGRSPRKGNFAQVLGFRNRAQHLTEQLSPGARHTRPVPRAGGGRERRQPAKAETHSLGRVLVVGTGTTPPTHRAGHRFVPACKRSSVTVLGSPSPPFNYLWRWASIFRLTDEETGSQGTPTSPGTPNSQELGQDSGPASSEPGSPWRG